MTTVAIPLTQEKIALVSDEDSDLAALSWQAQRTADGWLARRGNVLLARVVLARMLGRDLTRADVVAHTDGDSLNCTRDNLRHLTRSAVVEAQGLRATNTSGYRGVSWSKAAKAWQATITRDRKQHWLGNFHTAEEAAAAIEKWKAEN